VELCDALLGAGDGSEGGIKPPGAVVDSSIFSVHYSSPISHSEI
jgi:hypothetical protein